MFKKFYDKNGSYELVNSIDDIERIQEFTGRKELGYEIVDDPVFGKAYLISCLIKGE